MGVVAVPGGTGPFPDGRRDRGPRWGDGHVIHLVHVARRGRGNALGLPAGVQDAIAVGLGGRSGAGPGRGTGACAGAPPDDGPDTPRDHGPGTPPGHRPDAPPCPRPDAPPCPRPGVRPTARPGRQPGRRCATGFRPDDRLGPGGPARDHPIERVGSPSARRVGLTSTRWVGLTSARRTGFPSARPMGFPSARRTGFTAGRRIGFTSGRRIGLGPERLVDAPAITLGAFPPVLHAHVHPPTGQIAGARTPPGLRTFHRTGTPPDRSAPFII